MHEKIILIGGPYEGATFHSIVGNELRISIAEDSTVPKFAEYKLWHEFKPEDIVFPPCSIFVFMGYDDA